VTIELAGVTVRRGGRTILGPLDWTVHPGERWAVLGPNGSGKTTLLQVVSLYLWPTAGTVDVLGGRFGRVDAREQRRRIGYAGSAIEAEMDEALSPSQLVLSARHAALAPWWHVYDDADRIRAAALIERFGIAHVADDPFRTLSSGERRRVSISRALMPDPDLLLLDEPGAGLDLGARETLIRDLSALADEARPESIVLVSHHVEEIPPGFKNALVLAGGRGVAAGPIDDVLSAQVLGRAYGMPIAVERRDGRFWARRAD
jgi:iron complex transport system ATP-binding protein